MKTTITGFINYRPATYRDEPEFHFQRVEMESYGYVTVMPLSVEVDIPDDFDPRAEQVRLLEAKRDEVRAAFQVRMTEIEKQISQLTALTCEVTA